MRVREKGRERERKRKRERKVIRTVEFLHFSTLGFSQTWSIPIEMTFGFQLLTLNARIIELFKFFNFQLNEFQSEGQAA